MRLEAVANCVHFGVLNLLMFKVSEGNRAVQPLQEESSATDKGRADEAENFDC